MVRRSLPVGCRVLAGSAPVVAFGDPRTSEVATLGINPSCWAEFANADGQLLTGSKRRLPDAVSSGVEDFIRCSDEQVQHIAAGCFTYFGRRPYWAWFRPPDKLLGYAGLGSYTDGSACHLDLVQWATDPVWSKLPQQARQVLLEDGVPHLRNQLRHDNIRVVLLNGRTVLDHVEAVGLVALEDVGTMLYRADKVTTLYRGQAEGVVFLGWSVNIQGNPGANANAFLTALGGWIAGAAMPQPTLEQEPAGGQPPAGTHAADLDDLAALLERWLTASDKPTIGEVGRFGGRGWVRATLGGHEVVLNADTKRAAVAQFVEHVRAGTAVPRVVANARGQVNKVVFRPDSGSTPGWYCYTTTALDAPTEL